MGDFEQWEAAAAKLYSKSQLHFKHGFFEGMELSPMGQKSQSESVSGIPYLGNQYLNIVPFHSETWGSEFEKSGRAAVFLKEEWPEALNSCSPNVFIQLSPSMTTFKKAIVDAEKFQAVNLGIDPYSLGLWKSCLYKSQINEELVKKLIERESQVFRLSSQAFDMTGASDSQQLSLLLAGVMQLISDYQGVLSAKEVIQSLSFEVTLNSHLFSSVAKLTTLRLLLARLFELLEIEIDSFPPIYGAASAKVMSHREPWNNILKLTAMSAGARMGGADGFFSEPFDLFAKKPQGQRISRNVVELLELESYLGQVDLPTEGSFTQNELVSQMCERSWQLFTEIQKKEGLISSLRSGWVYNQVTEFSETQIEKVRKRSFSLTGSNQYPLQNSLSEEFPLSKKEDLLDFESWWQGQYDDRDSQHLCDVVRWVPKSLTYEYEKYQFAADEVKSQTGDFPEVAVIVEPGLEKSPKLKTSLQILKLGGFQITLIKAEEATSKKICLVVASDPDGNFVKGSLGQLGSSQCLIWAGEKTMDNFHTHIGSQTDGPELFAIIYKAMGRVV